jgi:hypothetical protein
MIDVHDDDAACSEAHAGPANGIIPARHINLAAGTRAILQELIIGKQTNLCIILQHCMHAQ